MLRTIKIFSQDYMAQVKDDIGAGDGLHDRMKALFEERMCLEGTIREVERRGAANAGRLLGFMQMLAQFLESELVNLHDLDAGALTVEGCLSSVEAARRKLLEQVTIADLRTHYSREAFAEFEAVFDTSIAKDGARSPFILPSWFILQSYDMFTADYILGRRA